MIYFDEKNNVIESFNRDLGKILTKSSIKVFNSWVVDTEEMGHYDTIKEYPNGGKDVKWVIDFPEKGHWESEFEDGLEHPEYKPTHDKKEDFSDSFNFAIIHLYTDVELKDNETKKQEAIKKAKDREYFMENGQKQLSDIMQAIAELGVLVTGGKK